MSIGAGLAILGLWLFAGMAAHSATTTNGGFWAAVFIAVAGSVLAVAYGG